jgi:hypothetical protein
MYMYMCIYIYENFMYAYIHISMVFAHSTPRRHCINYASMYIYNFTLLSLSLMVAFMLP